MTFLSQKNMTKDIIIDQQFQKNQQFVTVANIKEKKT